MKQKALLVSKMNSFFKSFRVTYIWPTELLKPRLVYAAIFLAKTLMTKDTNDENHQ